MQPLISAHIYHFIHCHSWPGHKALLANPLQRFFLPRGLCTNCCLSRTSFLTVFNPYFSCHPSEGPPCLSQEAPVDLLASFVPLKAPWLILASLVFTCDFPAAHWTEPQYSAVCLPSRNKQKGISLTKRLKEAQASIKIHTSNTYRLLYVSHTPVSKRRKEGERRETKSPDQHS